MVIAALLTFTLFFLTKTTAQDATVLRAAGGNFASAVYADWSFAFAIKSSGRDGLIYDSIGAGAARSRLSAELPTIDFADTSAAPPEQEYINNASLGLQIFPVVAGPIVLVYNLPLPKNVSSQDCVLFVNRVGKLTYWNDTRLVSSQTDLALGNWLAATNNPIGVTVRSDSAGITQILSSTLGAIEPSFAEAYGPFSVWPSVYLNGTITKFTSKNQNTGVLSHIQDQAYTLGYVSYSLAYLNSWTQIGLMKNRAGKIVSADPSNITFSNVNFTDRFAGDLTDLEDENAWPMTGFSYLLIATTQQPYHNCARRREMMKFFNFILENEDASVIALANGFKSVPRYIADLVLEKLQEIECDGKSLLAWEYPEHYENSFVVPVSVILGILGVASLLSFFALWYLVFAQARLPIPMLIFGIVICFSAIVGYVGVGMWLIVPNSDGICMARVWLGTIAIAILLGTSIARASQIRQFASIMRSKKSVALLKDMVQNHKIWQSLIDVFIILAAQLIILIVWQIVDPYRPELIILDEFELVAEWHCVNDTLAFWGIQLAFDGLVVLYGVFQIYHAWDVTSRINQSKWILLSLYNVILTAAACLPIISLISGELPLSYVVVSGVTFCIIQLEFSFLLPSLWFELDADNTITSNTSKSARMGSRESNRSKSKTSKSKSDGAF